MADIHDLEKHSKPNETLQLEDNDYYTDDSDVITLSEPFYQLLSLVLGNVHDEWEHIRIKCNSQFRQAEFASYLLSLHNESCERCTSIDTPIDKIRYALPDVNHMRGMQYVLCII